MDCQISRTDDIATVVIIGSLDSSWSDYFSARFDEVVRGGALEVRIDMSGVSYLSSNGIALLMRCHRQMRQIGGRFRIVGNSDTVGHVLRLTGVLNLLTDEGSTADAVRTQTPAGLTCDGDGVTLQVFKKAPGMSPAPLELIGDAARLPHRGYAEADDRIWCASPAAVALGLGALGPSFDACRGRFGEFLAVAGVCAYRPSEGAGQPDFEQAAGAFVPEMHLLYGLSFSMQEDVTMVRFESHQGQGGAAASLSKLAQAALLHEGSDSVGVVLIGETAGLVGTALRRSPVGTPAELDIFAHTQARDWLSLTSEPEHARGTALVVGVATRRPCCPALAPFVRPLTGNGPAHLRGHFHAAVVPYRPLPRGTIKLAATVQLLFEPGRVENVLHLLADSRPIVGAGESTFTRGVFWVVSLADRGEMKSP